MSEPVPLYVVHDTGSSAGDELQPSSFHTSWRSAVDRINNAEDNGIDTLKAIKIQVPTDPEPLKDFLDEVSDQEGLFDGTGYTIPEFGT